MRRVSVVAVGLLSVLLLAASAGAALSPEQTKRLVEAEQWAAENPQACALLDDPKASQLMDGLLLKLAVLCGRTDLLGRVAQEENEGPGGEALGTDVRANNVAPRSEAGSRTQSETAVALNETTGTLCSGFNDSYSGVVQGLGYTGFSRSTDGGATWSDRGSSRGRGRPELRRSRPRLAQERRQLLLRHPAHQRPRLLELHRRLPDHDLGRPAIRRERRQGD